MYSSVHHNTHFSPRESFKSALTIESVHEILKFDHSNES